MPLLADVALPLPLAHAFTYAVPDAMSARARVGARVLCPVGHRQLVGVVMRIEDRPMPEGLGSVRSMSALLDDGPFLPEELTRFLLDLSRYYLAPIGEVFRMALPAVERAEVEALTAQGALDGPLRRTRQVGGRRVLFARPTAAIEGPGALRGQAAAVLAKLRAVGEMAVSRLTAEHGNARAALKKLETLGLVEVQAREVQRDAPFAGQVARDEAPILNDAQATAVAQITERLRDRSAAQLLLFGVTGSGKTEVYLAAIAVCLAEGRGALVLVPEIALTPLFVSRFRARFGDDVAVLHSGLADADRHAFWQRLHRREVHVAIGARSALFAPVPDLGLVIVDEEHDSSFKQEEGVRYHGRDMALLRAHRAGAVAVLGSATPALETIRLVEQGKLVELRLPARATAASTLPVVELVNLRTVGPGPTGHPLLSLPLHRAIEETLTAGEQAIVFLNRRGFAPSVVCEACGAIETCKQCSVALTFHRWRERARNDMDPRSPTLDLFAPERSRSGPPEPGHPRGSLRCHYCDFRARMTEICSACGERALTLEGLGTEQLEDTLAAAFPTARIARLDRDTGAGAKAQRILDRMHAREIDLLVGTQMVTKGHDLPLVTLVGVVNADAALSMPDFRASERTFQLLVQVAGRAGRRDRPGRVLIQTRQPGHPAIRFAAAHDVRGFLRHELADRAEVPYPPFARLALVRIDAVDEHEARAAAEKIASAANGTAEVRARRVDVLGPAAAPIARLRNRYRFRVMLRARDRAPLRAVIEKLAPMLPDLGRGVRAILDVDPVAML